VQSGAKGILDAMIRNGIAGQEKGDDTKIQEADINLLFTLIHKSEETGGTMEVGWVPKLTGLVKVTPLPGVEGKSQWVLPKHLEKYQSEGKAAFTGMQGPSDGDSYRIDEEWGSVAEQSV